MPTITQLAAFYDEQASTYETIYDVGVSYTAHQSLTADIIALNLSTSLDVLDVGCGTGLVGVRGPTCRRWFRHQIHMTW
jgi:predicted TPR repeat methyltransferase